MNSLKNIYGIFFLQGEKQKETIQNISICYLYTHVFQTQRIYKFSSHRHRGKITNLCSIYFLIAVERSIKLLNKKICIQIYFQHVAKQLNYLFLQIVWALYGSIKIPHDYFAFFSLSCVLLFLDVILIYLMLLI